MLTHRPVYESAFVRMDVHCCFPKSSCGDVEQVDSARLAVPPRGTFASHFSPRSEITAGVNTAVVLHPRQPFWISQDSAE